MATKQREPRKPMPAEATTPDIPPEDPPPYPPASSEGAPPDVPPAAVAEAPAVRKKRFRYDKPKGAEPNRPQRHKVQIALGPLELWKLKIACVQEGVDACVLVRRWIGPHLAEYDYPTQPEWLKQLVAKEAERQRQLAAEQAEQVAA